MPIVDANAVTSSSNHHTNQTNTKTSTSSTDTNKLSARDEIFLKKEYDTPITKVSPTAIPPVVETNNNLATNSSNNLFEEVAKVKTPPVEVARELASAVNNNLTAMEVKGTPNNTGLESELTSKTNNTVREVKVSSSQEVSSSSNSQSMSETELTKTVTSIFPNAKKVS